MWWNNNNNKKKKEVDKSVPHLNNHIMLFISHIYIYIYIYVFKVLTVSFCHILDYDRKSRPSDNGIVWSKIGPNASWSWDCLIYRPASLCRSAFVVLPVCARADTWPVGLSIQVYTHPGALSAAGPPTCGQCRYSPSNRALCTALCTQYTVYNVQITHCVLQNAHCVLHSTQFVHRTILHIISMAHTAMFTSRYTLYMSCTVHCKLHTMYCAIHSEPSVLHTVHCTLHTTHDTLHSV